MHEVLAVQWAIPDGNLGVELGPDPPAVLVEAIGVYRMALACTQSEDRKIERDKRERENAARKAKAGRG